MANQQASQKSNSKKFLGIRFLGCNTYGRLYPNQQNTHFVGRCPKCGLTLKVRIGEGGLEDRFFNSPCLMNRVGGVQPRHY